MGAVADIRRGLAAQEARLASAGRGGRAAVAAILHEPPAGARLLFIERARRAGDPWSGDIAFPGGRVEPDDGDERDAAERETREEVGLDLAPAHRLGRLDDLPARVLPVTVSAFVYAVDAPPPLVASAEVRHAFWMPLADLLDAGRRREHVRRAGGAEQRFPAIDLLGPGRPLLWGVTYRFVAGLARFLGCELA